MDYPKEQIEELKRYCAKLSKLEEGGITYFYLEALRLPPGCEPAVCDGLLCPVPRDNYPSRLFLSVRVRAHYERNWNAINARIGEKNWFAFSWKDQTAGPTLVQTLITHLNGFAKKE